MTGFDSPRELRSSVSRGSDSPPDCHSLPLLFKSHHPYKQKRHNRKGRALFVGAGDGIWFSRELRARSSSVANVHRKFAPHRFPFKSHNLYKAKWQSHKDSAISLGAGDGIWTHTSLNTGTWNQRVCRSATPAFFSFRPLFLHGENARGGAYNSDKSYFLAYSAIAASNSQHWNFIIK